MYFIGYKDEKENRMYCFKGYDRFNSPEFSEFHMRFYDNLDEAKIALNSIYEHDTPAIFTMDVCKIYEIPLSIEYFQGIKPVYDYEDYLEEINTKFCYEWNDVVSMIPYNHKLVYMDRNRNYYFWLSSADCLVYTRDICPSTDRYDEENKGYQYNNKYATVAINSFFMNQKFVQVPMFG